MNQWYILRNLISDANGSWKTDTDLKVKQFLYIFTMPFTFVCHTKELKKKKKTDHPVYYNYSRTI